MPVVGCYHCLILLVGQIPDQHCPPVSGPLQWLQSPALPPIWTGCAAGCEGPCHHHCHCCCSLQPRPLQSVTHVWSGHYGQQGLWWARRRLHACFHVSSLNTLTDDAAHWVAPLALCSSSGLVEAGKSSCMMQSSVLALQHLGRMLHVDMP